MTPSGCPEICDPASDPSGMGASLGSAVGDDEGNQISVHPAGKEVQEEEGRVGGMTPGPTVELDTEFSCGSEVKDREPEGASICRRGGGGASELHQYDGVLEEGEGYNGLDCFLNPKVPAVSVMDRLTEIHGSEVLSFNSALAAQVAARSHSLINMEEQTFGDDEEEEAEDSDRKTPEED